MREPEMVLSSLFYSIAQEFLNDSLWGQPGLLPKSCFIVIHQCTTLFLSLFLLQIIYSFFGAAAEELSSYNKDHMACKAQNIYSLDLYRNVCQTLV